MSTFHSNLFCDFCSTFFRTTNRQRTNLISSSEIEDELQLEVEKPQWVCGTDMIHVCSCTRHDVTSLVPPTLTTLLSKRWEVLHFDQYEVVIFACDDAENWLTVSFWINKPHRFWALRFALMFIHERPQRQAGTVSKVHGNAPDKQKQFINNSPQIRGPQTLSNEGHITVLL